MSKNSKVDEVYEALRRKGKSESSAARIAKSVTGQSLAAGRKPRSIQQKAKDRLDRLRRMAGHVRKELAKK